MPIPKGRGLLPELPEEFSNRPTRACGGSGWMLRALPPTSTMLPSPRRATRYWRPPQTGSSGMVPKGGFLCLAACRSGRSMRSVTIPRVPARFILSNSEGYFVRGMVDQPGHPLILSRLEMRPFGRSISRLTVRKSLPSRRIWVYCCCRFSRPGSRQQGHKFV